MMHDNEGESCGALEGISHELLIHRDNALTLAQGENWLRLVVSLDSNSALQESQEASMGAKPFPSISSLSEVGTIDAPTENCYLCIDVDGPYASVKDMRAPISSQDSEEEAMFDVYLARRKKQHEKLADLADTQESQGGSIYHALEALERRQLRMLHQGDRIVVRNNVSVGQDANDLVLEYRQYKGESRSRAGEEMTEIAQEQAHTSASADTEVSKATDRPQTQEGVLSGKSPGEEAYKTAFEAEPTQDSDDNSSYEDDMEATQAFPLPSLLATQSPEREKDSDDGASLDVNPPQSEKDLSFLTPAAGDGKDNEVAIDRQSQGRDERENGAIGTQPQEEVDGGSTENINDMSQSTRSIPRYGDDSMPPIPEESETNPPSQVMGIDQEEIQSLTASSQQEKAEGPSDTESKKSGSEKGPAQDDMNVDSDSDALLDDDDVKDASAGIKDTNEDIERTKAAKSQQMTQNVKRSAPAPDDEAMSDSSSITEIDEEGPDKRIQPAITSKGAKPNVMAKAVNEPAVGPGDEASCASSITEIDDMSSPRKGLMTVPHKRQTSQDEVKDKSAVQNYETKQAAVAETIEAGDAKTPSVHQSGEEPGAEPTSSQNGGAVETAVEKAADDKVLSQPPVEKPSGNGATQSIGEKDSDVSSSRMQSAVEPSSQTDKAEDNVASKVLDEVRPMETTEETSAQDDGRKDTVSAEPQGIGASAQASQSSTHSGAQKDRAHSAETEVTDNKSPTADHQVILSGKEKLAAKPGSVADNKVEEAEGVEEGEFPGGRSIRPEEEADVEGKTGSTEDVGPHDDSKAPEEDSSAIQDTSESKVGGEPTGAQNKEEEEREDSPTVTAKKRPTRRKASAASSESEEHENEDHLKTPANIRPTRRKAAAAAKEDKHGDNDESLETPAKKRGREGYALRGSARKRTRATANTSPSGDGPVRVLMTGVGETDQHKKMVAAIHGEFLENIEDARTATHVIAGDDKTTLRRTPKLMIGLCRTSKILHMDWLIKSAKAREPLPCNEFLLLKDKKAERQYDFVMRETMQRGDRLRRNDEFLLSGYWVYVCSGVAGDKAPPERELELIVDAAGGKWLSSVSARVIKDLDASKILIIAPEKPNKKKAKSSEAKDVEKAIKLGAQSHPASWLFRCIIRQSLDDDE